MQVRAQEHPVARFDGVLAIVGGGTVDAGLLRALRAYGARLVGADGGADRIAAAGLEPELIVGDLDSLENPQSWTGRVPMIHLTEQLTTDFEKALYSTAAPITVALGMTGGRFDHTLAALDAVTRHAGRRRLVLVDEHDIALALTGAFTFAVEPGDRVSVHPLAPVRFRRSSGLLYPLDGLTLAPGVRTGTSNVAVEGTFSILPQEGAEAPFLLIVHRKYLMVLLAALEEARSGP